MTSIMKSVVHWGNSQKSVPASPPPDLCEICGLKPKFVERGFKHPYCSRSCARSGSGASPTACAAAGCRATGKPAFTGYCSDAHAREAVRTGQVKACSQCNVQPRAASDLCVSCDRRARGGARLVELNTDGATFKNLRSQFLSEWESADGKLPTLEKVYEVIIPRDVRAKHEAYRKSLSTPSPAQEIRSFHSSQCICDLGVKDAALCMFKSCGICCIVKSSFKAFAFGAPANSGRFGDGIYSYRNPASADHFATSCTSSPYRVTIACDVIIDPGQAALTDDESIFVPVADAIIPAYVLMYTK